MIKHWDECCYSYRSGQAGEKWVDRNTRGKCQVLHLEGNNPLWYHRLRTDQLESSFDQKTFGGPGGWGDHEPATCIYSRGQQFPGLHAEECCQQPGRFHPYSLLSPDERHLECCAQSRVHQHKWDMNILEWVQQRVIMVEMTEASLTEEKAERAVCRNVREILSLYVNIW